MLGMWWMERKEGMEKCGFGCLKGLLESEEGFVRDVGDCLLKGGRGI